VARNGSCFITLTDRPRLPGAGTETGPTIIWLRGEHDIATDGDLSRVLTRAIALNNAALVLDLSKVELMSASTLDVIVKAQNFLRQQSRSLTMRSPSPQVQRIIDICGLHNLLSSSPRERDGAAGEALGSWVAVPDAKPADGQPVLSTVEHERMPLGAGQIADLREQAVSATSLGDIA